MADADAAKARRWRRKSRSRCASILARTCRTRTSARRSRPATWASCTSFTTGSAVDGPGIRLVAWTTACMFRCQYCHNPDTWTLSNGIPVHARTGDRGSPQICARAEGDGRRLHAVGRRAADAGPLRGAAVRRGQGAWASTPRSRPTAFIGDRLSDEELRTIDLVILDMKAFTLEQHKRVTGGRDNADSPRVLPPAGRAQAADVAALRARSGPHRRLPRKWRRWRDSPRRSASSNASRSCPSTRWGSTNGRGSGSTISSRRPSRPRTSSSPPPLPFSGMPGSLPIEGRTGARASSCSRRRLPSIRLAPSKEHLANHRKVPALWSLADVGEAPAFHPWGRCL